MDQEQKNALQVPAIFANRLSVVRTMDNARIAFGEGLEGVIDYHVAVRMADADMVKLRGLLNRIHPPADKQN